MKIKRAFLKMYIWLKYKTMSTEEVYNLTKKKRATIFENIKTEISRPENQWYNSILYFKENDNILELMAGDKRFLISAIIEFENHNCYAKFKVYKREIDLSYYPDAIRYTSNLIHGLGVKVNQFGESKFNEPQTGIYRRGQGNDISIDSFDANEFGFRIVEQINKL